MTAAISVVIPTYNRADLVCDTIGSVLGQSHPPAEIIVVDDGSTDDTAARLAQFGARIRYRRIDNAGVCRARNVGVAMARSPWIAFCDSDDLWRPDYLAHQAHVLSAGAAEYSFANFCVVLGDEWRQRSIFDEAPPGFWDVAERPLGSAGAIIEQPLYDRILGFQPIFPSAVVLTRRFFDRVGGFDESFSRNTVEDFEFTLRCVREAPIGIVKAPLVGIRKHPGNLSGNEAANLLGTIAILHHALARHGLAEPTRRLVQAEIALRSALAAEDAFAARDLTLFRELCAAVPPSSRSARLKTKSLIAQLPMPLADLMCWATTSTKTKLSAQR